MSDRGYTVSPTGAAGDGALLVPADTDLVKNARALYIGGAGDVEVQFSDGNQNIVTFVGVLAGTILAISVKQVRASTSATNVIALYE